VPAGLLPIQVPNTSITVYNDQPTNLNLLANAVDPNRGGTLVYSTVTIVTPSSAAQVNVDPNTGTFQYTPNYLLPPGLAPGQQPPNLIGDRFQFTVRDNLGAVSNVATATVTVVVSPVVAGFVVPSNVYGVTHSLQPVPLDVLSNVVINDGSQVDPTSVAVVPGAGPQNGTVSINPNTGLITYTPTFGYIGFDTFQYSVKDTLGHEGEAFAYVLINPTAVPRLQPDDLGGQMLVVDGTPNNDTIVVSPGARPGDVVVLENGVLAGPFHPTSRVVVLGYGGDDRILVSPQVRTPAWLVGGDGNDVLIAGGGPSVLLGGPGNNTLVANGVGRDLLIGGTGTNTLIGTGNAIFVTGTTSFDANQAALAGILAEWNSTHSYADRVGNLTGKATKTWANRLNGNFFLTPATIFYNGAPRLVLGFGGNNLFLP
jgi:Ca2+-binding RTX toxin-like protein